MHNNHTRLITNDEWDPVALWAEIHRLRAEVQGSDGFDSWKDAATAKYRITSVDNDGECEAECISHSQETLRDGETITPLYTRPLE